MKRNSSLVACLTACLITGASFAGYIPQEVGEYYDPDSAILPEGTYLKSCNISKLIVTYGHFKLIGECRNLEKDYQAVNVSFPRHWWYYGFKNINGVIKGPNDAD